MAFLYDSNKQLENERTALSSKLNTLQYSLASYKTEGADIEKDIEDLQKQIKAYEDNLTRESNIKYYTALAINIETYATHIAGLPVAVNICCHVNRHSTRVI